MKSTRFCGVTAVLAAVLAALVGVGCGGPSSREIDVTVTEPAEIDCVGVSNHTAVGNTTLAELAEDIARDWRKAHEVQPALPMGRTLVVNESEFTMNAFFAGSPHPSDFDGHDVVYQGDFHELVVEGRFREYINNDKADEKAGRTLCGERVLRYGVLSLTDDSTIEGRVRWTNLDYVQLAGGDCGAWIECSRDIRVEGLERD